MGGFFYEIACFFVNLDTKMHMIIMDTVFFLYFSIFATLLC